MASNANAQSLVGDGNTIVAGSGNGNTVTGNPAFPSFALGYTNRVGTAVPMASGGLQAIGSSNTVDGVNSVAIGVNNTVDGNNAVAIGTSSSAAGDGGSSPSIVGGNTVRTGNNTTAIGFSAIVNGENSQAFGTSASTTGNASIAIGSSARIIGYESYALGSSATVEADQSIAIGLGASVDQNQSTAIGTSASVTGNRSTAIGFGAQAAADNQVVLGGATNTSVVTNGVYNNVSQATDNVVTIGSNGELRSSSPAAFAGAVASNLTVVGSAGTQVTGGVSIQAGSVGTADLAPGSVTFSRLGSDVQDRIRNLESGLETANAGVSMAFAMNNIPHLSDPSSNGIFGIGFGHFEGETAVAFGGTTRITETTMLRGTASYSGNTFGVGVGLGWEF